MQRQQQQQQQPQQQQQQPKQHQQEPQLRFWKPEGMLEVRFLLPGFPFGSSFDMVVGPARSPKWIFTGTD